MRRTVNLLIILGLFVALLAGAVQAAEEVKKIRVGLGDIASAETLNLLIALENVKARGIAVELTAFKDEEVASQAIINGQADVCSGTPYTIIQNVKLPIRMFLQMQKLNFYPIVNKEAYKSWKDLDGQEITVHARNSGTEAIAKLLAQQNGIKYSKISYVPGAEVRAVAMIQGNIKATFVDAANKNMLMKKEPDKFMLLPMAGVTASDECLFAKDEFLKANPTTAGILVEEILKVWRKVNADPNFIVTERARLKLLPDMPAKLTDEILPYFTEAGKSGMYPNNGGGLDAVKLDFEFFTLAGQLKGEPASLKVEDFWNLSILDAVLAKIGKVEQK